MRSTIYYITVVLLCAVLSAVTDTACYAGQTTVVSVYSGAEAKLSDGRKIVYSGISVPGKKDKPFFQECLEAHRKLVQDAPIIVLVQPETQGKELKRIPVVAFSGTLLINAELIRQGYALAGHSDDDFRYRELFLQLQHEAYVAARGLWAYKDTFSEAYYVGSKAHRQFHRPDCLHAKNLPFEDRVVFRTKDEALAAGQVQDWRCCPLFRVPDNTAAPKAAKQPTVNIFNNQAISAFKSKAFGNTCNTLQQRIGASLPAQRRASVQHSYQCTAAAKILNNNCAAVAHVLRNKRLGRIAGRLNLITR